MAEKPNHQITDVICGCDGYFDEGCPACTPAPVPATTSEAAEINRLRAGLMRAMQYENKCDQTGKPCSDGCGCHLEAEAWCDDFLVGDPGRT